MICYSLALYSVDPQKALPFVAALRVGGIWQALAHEMPGHLSTSVLQSDAERGKFLVIDYWSSAAAYKAIQSTPVAGFLFSFLGHLSKSSVKLGMFVIAESANFADLADNCGPTELELHN